MALNWNREGESTAQPRTWLHILRDINHSLVIVSRNFNKHFSVATIPVMYLIGEIYPGWIIENELHISSRYCCDVHRASKHSESEHLIRRHHHLWKYVQDGYNY